MKKHTLVTILLLGLFFVCNAQKDSKKKFIEAEHYFLSNQFEKALPLYISVYNADTSNYNAAYRIGICYLHDPFKRERAIDFLKRASRNTNTKYKEGSNKETKAHINALYYLGFAYQLTLDLDNAIDAYTDYANIIPVENIYEFDKTQKHIDACYRAQQLLQNPRSVEIDNLGEKINTGYSEYNPCLTQEGDMMIFTRTTFKNGAEDKTPYNRIMQSFKDGKKWSEAKDITDLIGANGEYKTLSLSAKGDFLLLHKESQIGTLEGETDRGSIYMTYYNDTVWSPIKKLPEPINSPAYETHASISSIGDMLYFTSNREGGYGGMDIYGCARYEDGTFGTPFNLGEIINTKYDEETPFLINDSLLFFSSQGHDNMGEFDVFFSKLNENKDWTTPVNMAPPVNLTGDDLFFVPVKNGQEGYYAVERHEGYKTYGRQDIYHIKLDVKDKVQSVKIAGSFAMDDNNELIPHVYISLVNPKTGETLKTVEPNYKTGQWDMTAPAGDYSISITADNYDDLDKSIHVPKGHNIEVKAEFKLKPKSVTSGEFYTVKAVFFDYNSAQLTRQAQQEIERLYLLMDKNPSLYIEVVGYTDSKGSASYNKKLSLKRSLAVINYLVRKGIEESRFVSSGKGAQDFVALNVNPDGTDNPEGRKLNRRVEMKIIKSDNDNIIAEDVLVPDNLKYKEYMKYSIQLTASATKLPASAFVKYNATKLPKYEVIESENGYIYYTGDFASKNDAIDLLNKVTEAGFEDAEITDYFKLNKQQQFKITKENKESADEYTIQLCASIKPLAKSEFKGIENIRTFHGRDNYYRYIAGKYDVFSTAETIKDKMIAQGFNDAFVANLSSFDKMEEIVEGSTVAPKLQSKSGNPKKTATTKKYTIQIIAMKKQVPDSYFRGLEGVVEDHGKDGYYRYHHGVYNSWSEAEKAQKDLISKGFKGAYVVNLSRYE